MPTRPRRPAIPDDDLYVRLEVPPNASFEAIEVAWRALLKRHHPDVAGDDGLEASKRINVAHDWLRDPALRTRYDDGRLRRSAIGDAAPRWPAGPRPASSRHVTRRPVSDPAVRRERFLARVAGLSRDELDRLACAESPPLAFVAAIRRFLLPERLAAVERIERDVRDRLDPTTWHHAPSRDAVIGAAHDLVLGDFLDEHLDEPFRERAHERLTRAWEAAVGQPRYGPSTAAVIAFVDRVRRVSAAELQRLEGSRNVPPTATELPWPPGFDPEDHEGLRVSSALAIQDANASIAATWPGPSRHVAAVLRRTAHALVLCHAFDSATYDAMTIAWRVATEEASAPNERTAPRPPSRAASRTARGPRRH